MIVSDEVYRVKQGATGPPLSGTLPVTILGANVVMKMVNVLDLDGPVLGGACVNLDTGTATSKGRFSYSWQSSDTATPGVYRLEFHVTFAPSTPDETVEIFPEDDYDHVEVVRSISGAFSPPAPSGSAPRVIDLGTVHIVDLLNGPQTLYTPTGPLWVVRVAVDRASLVVPDCPQAISIVQGSPPFTSDPDTQLFYVQVSNSPRLVDQVHPVSLSSWAQDEPIIAGINTGQSGYFLDEALGPWQAGVTYGEAKECILESGHIWSSSAGTTGGSKPDFAGSPDIGTTVADNTVTWLNEGAIPTTGSAHFYALVA